MKKTILITGIAGFIGFHVAQALKQRGDHVLGIDNFNSYYSPELKRQRAQLLTHQGIEVIECDLNDHSQVLVLFQNHSLTHVLNLAAQAGVRYAQTHPKAYISSNIDGFLSLLEILRLYPQIKLIYASSSSVYGCNSKTPFSITDPTDQPANLYAATKKANELMAYSYHHQFGIRSLGLRFFTVYGPWGRPDMAYYSFTQAILEGRAIHLFNEGKMQRDFTYIDDVVRGTVAAVDYEMGCDLFNIGNSHPVPLLTFIEILENLLKKKALKIFEEARPGEVEITYADISETERKLNFKPITPLEIGLKNFIEWYTAELV